MMENSRNRSRKSKLELRGVDTQIKDQNDKDNELSIAADPVVKQEKSSDTEMEDKDAALVPISHKPLKKFSVKVEVEECDAAVSDDSHAAPNMSVIDKTAFSKTSDVQTVDASTSNVFVATVGNKQNKSDISIKDKIQDKLKAHLNDANRQDINPGNDKKKQFKEYTTYKPMILQIANSLLKSNNFADKALMIEALNYVGRVPDEPKGIYFQKVLQEWNEWCQLHSAVRDSPLLYKCYVCSLTFWHLYDFREHVPTHNHMKNVNQYKLTIETENDECFLVYYKDALLKKDFEYPAGKCFKCHKSADNHKFAENVKNYRCIPCKVTFSTCSQLYMHEMKCLSHKNEFVPDDETLQECRICQAGFYTDFKLAEHLGTHHVVRSDIVTTWEDVVCVLCKRQLILPTLHTCIKKTNNYGCNYCGRSFQKKIYKEMHVNNYHKSFQCRICEKQLMAVCMEPSHFLQHTDRFALMYKCIECIVGRYYPDEYSIAHHTETVHNRQFEKKFKYLEMVILPKQCLDIVRKDLTCSAIENMQQAPMNVTSGPKSRSGSQDLSKAVPQPIPEPMYSINMVIKDEPVDDNVMAAVRVEPLEIKKEIDTVGCIQISDDLLKLNDKPQEEEPSKDLVIVESNSDDSGDESKKSRKKFTGPKRKRLAKYSCTCGYVAVQRKMISHKQRCIAVLAMKQLRDSRKRATAGSSKKLIMARGRGTARGGGRGGPQRGGRRGGAVPEPVKATPGPSLEPSRPKSLLQDQKKYRLAKAMDAKNIAKLSPTKRKLLQELNERKQVGNFRMPDAPEPKKGKRKAGEETRVWGPCPLLSGVPAVPPPHVPQRWELERSHDITEEEDAVEGTPPDMVIPQQLFAKGVLSADTPPRTAAEAVVDIHATEAMCPLPGPSQMCPLPGPSQMCPPRKKNRKVLATFPPSTGIVQCTVEPLNVVPAEIEFLDFTPSSATSTAAPESGRSAYEFDVDMDFERDCVEHGEGSDVDNDEHDKPGDSDCLEDPLLVEALHSMDADADLALRTVLDPGADQDLLSFDWRSEPEHFEGVREAFNVPSPGPTFNNADLTPLDVFLKIWDADLIAYIVQETNRYGANLLLCNQRPNSRIRRWKEVTDGEMRAFFAIIMLQSLAVNNVEREYWYPKLEELRIGNFGAIMPHNRFVAIKRCIHFVDNASLPERPNTLHKIMPIIQRLNDKFSSLYLLEQNVAIDESLLLWKGRLSFAQKIATKKARVGIKSYELCESRTGYLWRMEVYSGKGHVHGAQVGSQEPVEEHEEADEPESAASQIVLTLMRPLFNRGHTVIMDNFYNAPLLSRILKVKHKTDSMGTLRLNREFVPEGLRNKAKHNMKAGEVAFSSTKDLSVVVWKDKNVVAMISTYHQIKVGGIEKYGYYRYKPQVVLDYNLSMGGVDRKDQMLHAYPVERSRNMVWYKKLFRRLINVSIHNCFVMFNHNRTHVLGNREFRLQLAKQLLETCRPLSIPRQVRPPPAVTAAPLKPAHARVKAMHLPARTERPQRCKMCATVKKRRSTGWRCSTCAVNLCLDGCYTAYHTSSRFIQD